MGLFLIILVLYFVGIGVCRGVLSVVQENLDFFESSDWFWMLSIFWPFTLIPVAAWIFVEYSLRKK